MPGCERRCSEASFFRIRSLETTSSTNDEIKRALEAGEAEGLVVRALRQTGGYGRQGRRWTSPEGGLYCSLLLRPKVPPAVLPTLSLVVGIAVRRAVASLVDAPAAEAVRIKWPNDVVVDRDMLYDARARHGCCLDSDSAAQNRRCERFFDSNSVSDEQNPRSPVSSVLQNRSQRRFCANEDADAASPGAASPSTASPGVASPGVASLGVASPDATAPFAKLCGISCEAHAGGVCVGVGVNVAPPAERPDVGGKNEPAYVADLAPKLSSLAEQAPASAHEGGEANGASPESVSTAACDRAPVVASSALDAVLGAFLDAFAPLYKTWQREGFAPFLDEYNAHASLIGRDVTIVDRDGVSMASGVVTRVDVHGRLVLLNPENVELPVTSGEAHIA